MKIKYQVATPLKAQLSKWLRETLVSNEPFREIVQVHNTRVSQADLVPALEGFRQQRKLLDWFNLKWPAALAFTTPDKRPDRSVWIPLDIKSSPNERLPNAQTPMVRDWLTRQLTARSEHVRHSGLQVRLFSTTEMTNAFTDLVSDVIVRRIGVNTDSNNGPASDMFTVETDSQGVEVLFCLGVFLSTAEGFGISTPARRRLPWGYYMFGAMIHGHPDFSNSMVWKVPDTTSYRLKV
jgi:hypothetical protein